MRVKPNHFLIYTTAALFAALSASGKEVSPKGVHHGWVNATVYISTNALATVSGDSTLKIWNPGSGDLSAELVYPQEGGFNGAAFSPDGTKAALCGAKGGVEIFSIAGAKVYGEIEISSYPIVSLNVHKTPCKTTAFSKDGTLLASGAYDGNVIFWNAADWRPLKTINMAHKGGVSSVAFSTDAKLLATAGYDGKTRLWSAPDGTFVRQLAGHYGNVNSVSFSPDGKFLATAGRDGKVFIWKTPNWKVACELKAHGGPVNAAAFTPDNRHLATISDDEKIKIWRTEDCAYIRTIRHYGLSVLSAGFSPSGDYLAAGFMTGAVRVYPWKWEGCYVIKNGGTAVTNSKGTVLGRFEKGQRVAVNHGESKPGMLFVDEEKLYGWVKKSDMLCGDNIRPSIHIISKEVSGGKMTVKAASLDDTCTVSASVNGKPLKRSWFEAEAGNYAQAWPFHFTVAVSSGGAAHVTATDCSGKTSRLTVEANAPVAEYAPWLVYLRSDSPVDVRDLPAANAPVTKTISAGSEFSTLGYRKGWYVTDRGGWILPDAAPGR